MVYGLIKGINQYPSPLSWPLFLNHCLILLKSQPVVGQYTKYARIKNRANLLHCNSTIFIKLLPRVFSHPRHQLLKNREHPLLIFQLIVAVLLQRRLAFVDTFHLQRLSEISSLLSEIPSEWGIGCRICA